MLEHRVKCRQQFPHTGNERHLLGFSQFTQALIERLDRCGLVGPRNCSGLTGEGA